MKVLTLNTHSLIEKEYEKKLQEFAKAIQKEEPDIIALQEVNQTSETFVYPSVLLNRFVRCRDCDVVIRKDNHAARLAEILEHMGCQYYWTWIPVKLGYNIYDEGLAIFSKEKIVDTHQFPTSRTTEYKNWKTRKALGIQTNHNGGSWFYCVHMGWWHDKEEPFSMQWDAFEDMVSSRKGHIWVMGDFNSPADVRNEGYDYVKRFGWKDSYLCAREKDSGYTVEKVIDGWRDKETAPEGMRIDMIWSKQEENVMSSKVLFNGKTYPVVSDHYGVMIDVE